VGHLVQTPCQSRVTYSRLHRILSRWVLNISREGDSTISLGSLGQGSVTLREKKFFLMFRRNLLCLSLCPLPLVLSLGTTEKSLAPPLSCHWAPLKRAWPHPPDTHPADICGPSSSRFLSHRYAFSTVLDTRWRKRTRQRPERRPQAGASTIISTLQQ